MSPGIHAEAPLLEATCKTHGCFEVVEGADSCGLCLEGTTPEKRGPVSNRELLYARQLGGPDAAVTRARLRAHGQSTAYLDAFGRE